MTGQPSPASSITNPRPLQFLDVRQVSDAGDGDMGAFVGKPALAVPPISSAVTPVQVRARPLTTNQTAQSGSPWYHLPRRLLAAWASFPKSSLTVRRTANLLKRYQDAQALSKVQL